MDLEEELSLIHQEKQQPQTQNSKDSLNSNESDDLLGLDKQIKLSDRAKIAKIDNERLFDKQKGLNYIITNHNRLIKTFNRNDKILSKKLSSNPHYSSKYKKQLKFENEFKNLSSVLQFYQLWCHGLFPKARFKDCLHLIRSFGARSSQLKLYRSELIDLEINKLKIKNGMIEGHESNSEAQYSSVVGQEENLRQEKDQENDVNSSANDDDWSFMNVNQTSTNGLFVANDNDDDDLYHTPSRPIQTLQEVIVNRTTNDNQNIIQNKSSAKSSSNNDDESNDPFSDEDEAFFSINNTIPESNAANQPNEVLPNGNDLDDEYANEMEVMREMGL